MICDFRFCFLQFQLDHFSLVWFCAIIVDMTIDLALQTKRVRRHLSTSWVQSLTHVLATGWNTLAMVLIPLYIVTHIMWLVATSVLTDEDFAKLEKQETPGSGRFSLWLLSLVPYSFVHLLLIMYMASFFVVNSYMGPLLQALVNMVKEALKFFIFFSLLFFAFTFSFKKLYLVYSYGERDSSHIS